MTQEQRETDPQPDRNGETKETPDINALQTEVAQLRQQVDEHQEVARARQHRGRGWAVGLLIVLGMLLLAVANMTFWLRGTVLNTDRWVAAVGPLSRNETVAKALSIYAVDALFEMMDVEQVIAEALPPEYSFLSGGLTRVLQNLAQETTTSLVQSDQFNAVWVGLNRAAHQATIGVLRGKGDLLYLQEGQLTLDLSDVFDFVTNSFNLQNREILQGIQTKFVLLESQQVAVAQQALALIDGIGLLFPLFALGALFLAWLISLWRRRTLMWIGVGVAVTMALSILAFALAQPLALMSIADPFVRLLAGEVWGVVVRGLYIQTIAILVVGLFLIAGTALASPSSQAIAIRTGLSNGWNRLRKH